MEKPRIILKNQRNRQPKSYLMKDEDGVNFLFLNHIEQLLAGAN